MDYPGIIFFCSAPKWRLFSLEWEEIGDFFFWKAEKGCFSEIFGFRVRKCASLFTIFVLLFCLPPSRNSDPGSHSRLFSPPPHYGSCLAFLSREELFLPSSTRVELCLPTLGTLSSWSFSSFLLQIKSKSRHGGNRTHGPTLLIVAFEG